jgi:hypothetical protein
LCCDFGQTAWAFGTFWLNFNWMYPAYKTTQGDPPPAQFPLNYTHHLVSVSFPTLISGKYSARSAFSAPQVSFIWSWRYILILQQDQSSQEFHRWYNYSDGMFSIWTVRTILSGRPDTIGIRVKNVRYAWYGYDDIQTNRWSS